MLTVVDRYEEPGVQIACPTCGYLNDVAGQIDQNPLGASCQYRLECSDCGTLYELQYRLVSLRHEASPDITRWEGRRCYGH